jgi:hypothetical protein
MDIWKEFEGVMDIWQPIPGHEGYEVSQIGKVRSIYRTVIKKNKWGSSSATLYKGRLLKPWLTKDGYYQVELSNGKKMVVHRLVAMAFIPGDHSLTVNHKNNIKTDNRPDNLEWVSAVQNTHHALYEIKCFSKPAAPVFLKNTKNETVAWFRSMADAARHLDVTTNAVQNACSRGGRCRGYLIEKAI